MKGRVLCLSLGAILFLFLVSCRQRYQKLSLSNEKLVPLLCDVHLSEAALQTVQGALKDSLTNVYLAQICEIHKISRERLEEVLEELRNNPDAMKKAYQEVAQRLQQRGNPQ
jgi:hypothetical protein